jgi:hypothetical protein
MTCTKARALRQGLSKIWDLPDEKDTPYTGTDWVLILLDRLSKDDRDKMMFIWWRAWHHRNNIIFDKGDASITNSIRFLQNYRNTLQDIASGGIIMDRKGKKMMQQGKTTDKQSIAKTSDATQAWCKPNIGWYKCNVDASFTTGVKCGAWGAIIRDHLGHSVSSAWGYIPACESAAMGEALACLEGLKLYLSEPSADLIIESDCSSILKAFEDGSEDRSIIGQIAT